VIETDAPWGPKWTEKTKVPLAGQLAALLDIAEVIGRARGASGEDCLKQSSENLKREFDL
jgi:Tat protein secretion system quality control protein TatD with DNase activity